MELLVITVLTRWIQTSRVPLVTVFLAVLGVNLVTHPVAWYAAASVPGSWTAVEGTVVVVEFLLLRVTLTSRTWQAGLFAIAANGTTALLSFPRW